ncbi:MAG: glycogen synthase [Oscillospiraceae bacterium]|nr:glycogen synthase [Oscillospiraceae bacterium]
MKVLFVTSESFPFSGTGGLGEVSGALPRALRGQRIAARVVLPLYGGTAPEYRNAMKYITSFYVPVAWRNQYCGVYEYTYGGVKHYFIDNEYYFKREGLYGYFDDAERFAFFCRAVLEMFNRIDFFPQILHCNDWQTSLVPVYLDLYYRDKRKYYGIKTLTTIHNIQYQGKYYMDIAEDVLGIGKPQQYVIEYNNSLNLLKGAITASDRVSAVSPSYAKEILDPWYAHGLDPLLKDNAFKIRGILNGIDTVIYNPDSDSNIEANYSANDLAGKSRCKESLLEEFSLSSGDEPVIGIVSRLVAHKGFDLIVHMLEYILFSGMKVVVLGAGEYDYENIFTEYAARYPDRLGLRLGFYPKLAHRIYAGSDMLLMPSKSEPCGLSQMIALRYGSIPIVRETGGLKDTITDCGDSDGNGFTFKSYNAHDMFDACLRAKASYEDKDLWAGLVKRAMRCDNSWKKAAKKYVELYNEMLDLWE